MDSSLDFVFLARDAIRDENTNEISAIRIFETIYMGKDAPEVYYSFYVVGSISLRRPETAVSSNLLVSIIDSLTLKTIETRVLQGLINPSRALQFSAYFYLPKFNHPGEYKIQVAVQINEESAKILPQLGNFRVERLTK